MSPEADRSNGTPDPASRSGPKKQAVGTTGAAPATRTSSKNRTTAQTLADAQAKIKTLDDAKNVLRANELIPSGDPTAEGLVTGLSHLAAKTPSALMAEGMVAFAIYAKAVIDDLVSSTLADAVLTKFQARAESLTSVMEARVASAGERLQEHVEALNRVGESVQSQIVQAAGEITNAGGVTAGRGASPYSFLDKPSYADAVRTPLPGPDRAAQIKVADREKLLARQVLVDGFPLPAGTGEEATPSAADILAKANEAAGYMLDAPEDFRFTAARDLANGGVILETPRPEQAQWLREHATKFERVLGENARIRLRPFRVVAEFVPVVFDPLRTTVWREVENDLSLPEHSIVEARWIKPIERRHRAQRFAHLLLTLSSPVAANTLISSGLTIAGKHVTARKNLAEPMRCAKCHQYQAGHLARDCPQDHDICGTCGRAHRTKDCNQQDTADHKCTNCGKRGHATWSRECPVFLDHLRRSDARHPENRLRFFPTSDPDSWVPRLDEPPPDSVWGVVRESIERGPPAPSQRRRAAQARLTQSTLNFAAQPPPHPTDATYV